jgi:hypothetical protein
VKYGLLIEGSWKPRIQTTAVTNRKQQPPSRIANPRQLQPPCGRGRWSVPVGVARQQTSCAYTAVAESYDMYRAVSTTRLNTGRSAIDRPCMSSPACLCATPYVLPHLAERGAKATRRWIHLWSQGNGRKHLELMVRVDRWSCH